MPKRIPEHHEVLDYMTQMLTELRAERDKLPAGSEGSSRLAKQISTVSDVGTMIALRAMGVVA